jgi:cysteine-S-conjugate beta-lyase
MNRVHDGRHRPADDGTSVQLVDAWTGHRSIKWSDCEPGVLPAWVAEMDFAVALPIRDAVAEAVRRSDLGYAATADRELAQEVSTWYRREHGWSPPPEHVVLLPDVMRGVELALRMWSEVGEPVVTTTPVYHPFLESIDLHERTLADAPLARDEEGWALDLDAVRRGLSGGARLVLLSNPHNPTGTVFTREELAALAELVIEHDAYLVSDEVHAPLVHAGGRRHVAVASLGEHVARRTLTVTSVSKAWNVPGLKCALALPGSAQMHRALTSLPTLLFFGGSPLGIHASTAALRDGGPWLDAVRAELLDRRDLLGRLLAEHLPEVGYRPPDATYLAWLDLRDVDLPGDGRVAERLLQHARVRLTGGEEFGTNGEGRVRLNFATSRERLTEIVDRIATAVHSPPRTSAAKK